MCMPGDNVEMSVELITPIAIEKGLRFAIREGGRTVGSGAVTEITEPDFSAKKKNCRNAAVLFLPAGHSERAQSCSG